MRFSQILVVLGFLAGLPACDQADPPMKPPEPAPVASVAHALGIDAGELEPRVDPPAPAGDLKAEVDAFTTVDACIQQRAALDPVVGDALEAIGYDTIVRDACIVLDAAKSKDARRCKEIDATPLETRCEATVAEIAGDPEGCPFEIPTRPERGREPACLALASRDARLCAAAFDAPTRVTCEAIAAHDAEPCKRLPMRGDQARCARDEKRMASAIAAADAASGWSSPASAKATLGGDAIAVDASRGVVVLEMVDGAHLVVGAASEREPSFLVPSPNAGATLRMDLVVPSDPKKAKLADLFVEQPGKPGTMVGGAKAAAMTVMVRKFEKRRGGAVELTVEGQVDEHTRFRAEVTTFVRDLVKPNAMLGLSKLGDAGSMR